MGELFLIGLAAALMFALAIGGLPAVFSWRRKQSLYWVFGTSLAAGWLGLATLMLMFFGFADVQSVKFEAIERTLVGSFFLAFPCAVVWTLIVYIFTKRNISEE